MNEQELLEKTQQTIIPPFVSKYIEEAKYYEWGLDDVFDHISEEPGDSEISVWFYTLGNIDVLLVHGLMDIQSVKKRNIWLE